MILNRIKRLLIFTIYNLKKKDKNDEKWKVLVSNLNMGWEVIRKGPHEVDGSLVGVVGHGPRV